MVEKQLVAEVPLVRLVVETSFVAEMPFVVAPWLVAEPWPAAEALLAVEVQPIVPGSLPYFVELALLRLRCRVMLLPKTKGLHPVQEPKQALEWALILSSVVLLFEEGTDVHKARQFVQHVPRLTVNCTVLPFAIF